MLKEVCINLIHHVGASYERLSGLDAPLARLPCQGAIVNIKRMSQLIVTSPESFDGHGFRMCFLDLFRSNSLTKKKPEQESV